MRILTQTEGKHEVEYILKTDLYIRVFDYGEKQVLKKFQLSPGDIRWVWMRISENYKSEDLSSCFTSFDTAINRAVYDFYATVYAFDNFEEMIKYWDEIKYIDNTKVVYKSKDPEKPKGKNWRSNII